MPRPAASAPDNTTAAPLARALAALRALAAQQPVGDLRHADIARATGLPWQTVRSLLGPRERFAAWLERPGNAAAPGGTRSRILDAAARCFARKGYANASLDEVAAEAGLTKGAVYWHFAGKHDLFFALLDARCAEMDNYMPAVVESAMSAGQAARDPKLALTTLITGIVRRLGADPNWPRLFIEFFGQTRDPAVRARFGQRYLESYADVAAMVRAGIPTGSTPQGDPDDLAVFWIALIDGLMLAWLVNPDSIDLDARIARIIDILWDGLGARRQPVPPVEPS
ncbi:MAG: TetR family transcriptional regulator [Rhodocyclaceae bacterium]|nr:TetR family transcriptional regulator [Rhodocyclaceae bacterium]